MQLAARPQAPPLYRYLFAGTVIVWWEGTEGGENKHCVKERKEGVKHGDEQM
jgi:hypothetical protein